MSDSNITFFHDALQLRGINQIFYQSLIPYSLSKFDPAFIAAVLPIKWVSNSDAVYAVSRQSPKHFFPRTQSKLKHRMALYTSFLVSDEDSDTYCVYKSGTYRQVLETEFLI